MAAAPAAGRPPGDAPRGTAGSPAGEARSTESAFASRARGIDEQTPGDRDRYADLLRVVAILMVVFGHWMAAVVLLQDGEVAAVRLHRLYPGLDWATWLFQVMPVFFFVGGYANAISLSKPSAEGTQWVRTRARRLLRPVVPLLAVWVPAAALATAAGLPAERVEQTSWAALVPLWFLAAYVAVVAAAPLTHRLHRRWGVGALAGFVLVAALGDLLLRGLGTQRIGGLALFGWTNYFWVWGAIHQAGYFWHDGRLPARGSGALAIAAGGLLALLALTQTGVYPLAMVQGRGEFTNTRPPSVALLVLAASQIGLLLALRRPATRWMQRPRAWAPVAWLGPRIMTVFLWHMTALAAWTVLTVPTGIWPASEAVDAQWWALQPLWLLCLLAVLAGLAVLFGRFEAAGKPRPSRGSRAVRRIQVYGGAAVACAGITLLVRDSLHAPYGPLGVPWAALALLGAGMVALGVFAPASRPVQ